MDGFYRGVESTMLALSLALALAVATLVGVPPGVRLDEAAVIATTLPVIEIGPDAAGG